MAHETRFADGALMVRVEGEVARLVLNRPGTRNALNEAIWTALPEAVAAAAAPKAVKVLTLEGSGGAFASGADISEFERVWRDAASSSDYAAKILAATEALEQVEKPLIARITGACVGAGLALALACDLRYATTAARFGAPPGKLGLVYSLTDTRRLVEAVGLSKTKEILFTGRLYAAEAALAMGLVDGVYPAEDFEAAIDSLIGEVTQASQWSVRATKAVTARIRGGQGVEDDASRALFAGAAAGEDFKEGRAAFLEKRPPRFTFR